MNRILAYIGLALLLILPVRGATVTGVAMNSASNALPNILIVFTPVTNVFVLGVSNILLDSEQNVRANSNGVFSVSLLGGYYSVGIGYNTSKKNVSVPVNDTNTYNIGSLTWADPPSSSIVILTNYVNVTNYLTLTNVVTVSNTVPVDLTVTNNNPVTVNNNQTITNNVTVTDSPTITNNNPTTINITVLNTNIPVSGITGNGAGVYGNNGQVLSNVLGAAFATNLASALGLPITGISGNGAGVYGDNGGVHSNVFSAQWATNGAALTGKAPSFTSGYVTQNPLTNNSVTSTIWSGNTSGNLPAAATINYFAALGNQFTNLVTTDATTVTRNLVTRAGTIKNLYVLCSANPGSFANTVTIMTNGVASSIVANVNNVSSANDTTHSVTAAAGMEIGIKIVTITSSTPVKWSWSFEIN